MRVSLPELDISIFVSLSDVVNVTKAVVHIQSHHVNLLMKGHTELYSSIFRPLSAFDCGGRSIGEDWVRYISYQKFGTYTHTFTNKSAILSNLVTEYQTAIQSKQSILSTVIEKLKKEMISRKRLYFQQGDLLMYTTTISNAGYTKQYLMHVIME